MSKPRDTTVDVLVPGLGLRLNSAPVGYCTVALITAPDSGCTLVDTGAHPTREALLHALSERGMTPANVDTVVLTHLHFDHCENAALFSSARVIVHADEIAEAREYPDRDRYLADFWPEILDRCQPEVMNGSTLALDDTVTVVHLPGHRHGQLVVSATTANGATVCASDAAKNARELLLGQPAISDPDMYWHARRSVCWLLDHADIIIPGHDRPVRVVDRKPQWDSNQDILLSLY